MKLFLFTLIFMTALLSGCAVHENQRILNGKIGEVSVIIFSSTDCPIANAMAPEIERIHKDIHSRGGSLLLVHVWEGRTYTDATEHAKDYGLTMEVIVDSAHKFVKQFGATITPEAVVFRYDEKNNPVLVYQGLINNLFYSPGNRRDEATKHYVRDAIDAAFTGKSVTPAYRTPTGCVIEKMQ
jgi:hypothetical protein